MRVLAGILLATALYGAVDKDMQRAIAWERHKEAAAARQARLEKRHPSVTYSNNTADRSADDATQQGKKVEGQNPKKSK